MALAVFAGTLGGLAGGEAAFKNVPSVIRLSLSLVSPTLGSGCTHTQKKKVGSLLSSCWQLTKTMPIHSLGIEALSSLDRTPFLLALEGGGYPLSAFFYSEQK